MTYVDQIARILIELDDTDPVIWRRVELPLTTSLKGLHEVIQAAMPFEDYHLFMFEIGDQRYGIPSPEWDDVLAMKDAKRMKLGVLVDKEITRFSYTYDFGDDWRHIITIEATFAAADPVLDYPRLVKGERQAPPEDVGGIPEFEAFLDIMTKPRHRERKRLLEWYGGPFDPDVLDMTTIKRRIGKLAKRRAVGKASYAKSRNRLN